MSRSEFRGYTDGYSKLETHVETADKSGQSWCVHTTIGACGVRDIISEVRMNSASTSHCPIDGSMLVQLQRRWYNIDPSMYGCLLFAGNSATGIVKAVFFTIILFYRISLFI